MIYRIFKRAVGVALALTVIGFTAANADTRLVYDTPDGQFIIEYRDEDNMRFGVPDGSFLLVSDGDGYALTRHEGQWHAYSGDQIREMAAGQSGAAEQVRVSALGQHETVAGIRGERFRAEVGDAWANEWRDDGEVVLSTDSRVRPSGRAMQRMSELFGHADDAAAFGDVSGIDVADYGLLKAEGMRLQEASEERLPDHTFRLPPDVEHQTMADPGAVAEQEEADDSEPGWLSRQLEGARDDAQGEAESETRRNIRDGVRDGVRGLFD